jgi:hypothetical protein
MSRAFWFVVAALGASLCTACSSSSSPGSGPTDAGVDGANCVAPGSPGNAAGIGAYCNADAGCPGAADAGLICTADVNITPPNAYFCTKVGCARDSDCGQGSYCSHQQKYNITACIPQSCAFLDQDGGGL